MGGIGKVSGDMTGGTSNRHTLGPSPAWDPMRFVMIGTVGALSIVPRIVRMLYRDAWFEDTAYLYHAYLLSVGKAPFLDMLTLHPPLLEFVLSRFYLIFGVSYRTAELLTAFALAGASVLIYRILSVRTGRFTSALALLVFGLHPLFFRYHIFEREVFVLAAYAAAFAVLARAGGRMSWMLAGSMLGMAVAVKLSGGMLFFALMIVLLVPRNPTSATVNVPTRADRTLAALSPRNT
ncbi:glycosyltransferase family 39 protein [Acidobacteriota bacterium]